ncbi:hypothetical protein C8R43DRAFT_131281 [Mycena crocata]|nr:hypothetical protein C8R43DRAFT_131281 [Mycena crocata]
MNPNLTARWCILSFCSLPTRVALRLKVTDCAAFFYGTQFVFSDSSMRETRTSLRVSYPSSHYTFRLGRGVWHTPASTVNPFEG